MQFVYCLDHLRSGPPMESLCENQEQPFRGVLSKKYTENMQQINRRTPMPKCDFNKDALQLYWNHTSAWVLSCKFPYLSKVTSMESPLWGAHIIQWNAMVSQSKTTTSSNKAKWICTSLKAIKAKSNKGLKRIDTPTRG